MKCWRIDAEDWSDLVWAETRGKAKAEAVSQFDLEFTDVRLCRAPQGDGRKSEYPTAKLYLECACGHDLHIDGCHGCPGPMVFNLSGDAYCNETCRAAK